MNAPADTIRARARTVVEGVRADEVGAYSWLKKLVATTVKEYRGRFLYELIQNGFDAHPVGCRDGRIAVHFDDSEEEHGVLYVANGGRPLTESNFVRMASLGDSDKPIGVGIGNKGVGFKSVFQICEVPEVYSAADTEDPGFSGFSFRFGTSTDLDDLMDPRDPLRVKVESELSFSLLAVPLEITPSSVAAFRSRGYVTVLRLPASSTRAATEIRDRIDRLLTSKSPIMLFLDRLETMSIRPSTEVPERVLTRREDRDGNLTRVVLNGTDSYLTFEGDVASQDLRSALHEAVQEGALDESWLAWTAEASVSVAVGDGWLIQDPSAFTFLPMGEAAASPLGGHVNAPFVTDFARLGLDVDHPVNRLMLRRVAEVCVEAGDSIATADGDAAVVVDLLAWNADSEHWIEEASQRLRASSLADFIRVPTIGRTDWCSLGEAYAWGAEGCSVITVDRLVASTTAPLIDMRRIDTRRLSRLAGVTALGAGSLAPDDAVIADWVERVAATLEAEGAGLETWRSFYDDLAAIFSSGEALYGKKIILTESGSLAPADRPPSAAGGSREARRRDRAVFFSPRTAGTEDDDAVDSDVDISPPPSLARRLIFLNGGLNWYDGQVQTPGRRFLQNMRLARQFRTASLLSHLGQVMAASPSDAVKRDALHFAFRLFSTNPTKYSKELADVGLAVPVVTGAWVAAADVHFSAGWDVPGADDLSELAAGAPDQASELAGIVGRLLAEPAVVGGGSPNVSRWVSFLKVLGVSASLPINQVKDDRRLVGHALTAAKITGLNMPSSMPVGVAEQWKPGISATGNHHHPETWFSTKDAVCWLVGQHEVEALPVRLRQAYARLVILTLPTLSTSHKRTTWSRDRVGGFSTLVETPLWVFLSTGNWVPIVVPNEPGRGFGPPSRSWFVRPEDAMAASYSPLIDPPLRTLMESVGERHWKELGFREWRSTDDAAPLIDHLTEVFGGRDVPDTASEHFRSSLAAAWRDVGDPEPRSLPALDQGMLIERSGQVSFVSAAELRTGRLYVTSTRDQTASARLVRELGWPVLAVDSGDDSRLTAVAEVLRESGYEEVQVTSEWDLEVLLDGAPWEASETAQRVVDEVPWLPLLLACCMRYPRASGMRIGRQLARVLDDLSRIRVERARKVEVTSPNGNQALPSRLHGILPMAGDVPTLLAEASPGSLSWGQFELLTQSVLELLGQERFKAEVSLTIRDLSSGSDAPIDWPSNGELAESQQVSEAQIREVESAVLGAVSGIVARLALVAPCLWGEAAVGPLRELAGVPCTRDDVLRILSTLCGDEARASTILVQASDAPDADSLRRRLGVTVAQYNQELTRHHPSVPLTNNAHDQREEFDLRRRQRQRELVDWARHSRVGRFLAGEIQNDWTEVRDLSFLEADADWATTLDEVGQDRLDSRIDVLMTSRLGPRPMGPSALPSFEEVRAANGHPLVARLVEAKSVVKAWGVRESVVLPVEWVAESAEVDLRNALELAGALDFTSLGDIDLAKWLNRIGAWPEGMALSVAADVHGLTYEELHEQERAEAEAKVEKARAARRINFQDSVIDLTSMSVLVDRVNAFLSSAPASLNSPYRTSALASVSSLKEKAGGGGAKGLGGQGGVVADKLSNEQKRAIGLVGEMIAFHWLVSRDPSGIVDASCWKSGNCGLAFQGAVGDDSLGYDFAVPRRGGPVMYEVKATSGDAGMIELGETEVRCAQENSRTDRWRLLVVEQAMSAEPRIHMLPNPFNRDSRSVFNFVGNSVRLRFALR